MSNAGTALMGIGIGKGKTGAEDAARAAISSPLLDSSIDNAKGVVFNISGGEGLSLTDVNRAARLIYDSVEEDANVIFGALIDESLDDSISITVLATGFADVNNKQNNLEFLNHVVNNSDGNGGGRKMMAKDKSRMKKKESGGGGSSAAAYGGGGVGSRSSVPSMSRRQQQSVYAAEEGGHEEEEEEDNDDDESSPFSKNNNHNHNMSGGDVDRVPSFLRNLKRRQ